MIYSLSAAFIAGAVCLWFLARRAASPAAIRSRERRIALRRLPAHHDGLRILHISDLHLGPGCDSVNELTARAQAAHPDLVAITGDLASGWRGLPLARRLLERLASRWPTYVVPGNADRSADRFDRELQRWGETGAQVLLNQGRPLRDGDSSLWMGGVDDPHRFRDDPARALAGAPPDAFRLLLAHSPDVVRKPESRAADLILTGHTHGGQVRLPLVGALYTRTRLGRRFARGVFHLDGTTLIVSSGVGVTRLGIRFCCPPEMTLWVLRRANSIS